MEKYVNELCDRVARLTDGDLDPLARCIADQLVIVLNSLLGLDRIACLVGCPEAGD